MPRLSCAYEDATRYLCIRSKQELFLTMDPDIAADWTFQDGMLVAGSRSLVPTSGRYTEGNNLVCCAPDNKTSLELQIKKRQWRRVPLETGFFLQSMFAPEFYLGLSAEGRPCISSVATAWEIAIPREERLAAENERLRATLQEILEKIQSVL